MIANMNEIQLVENINCNKNIMYLYVENMKKLNQFMIS